MNGTHWSVKPRGKRETAVNLLKFAGYHGDSQTYTRLLIERPRSLSYEDAMAAIRGGMDAKDRGVRCGCRECNPEAHSASTSWCAP